MKGMSMRSQAWKRFISFLPVPFPSDLFQKKEKKRDAGAVCSLGISKLAIERRGEVSLVFDAHSCYESWQERVKEASAVMMTYCYINVNYTFVCILI
mmetsp:Transcript_1925/g.3126  ORF Transcript_1925/g.3126 Transcript_1925/m.3126 type:complete len:97 (+) Transcript_1925:297-587(+)